MAPVSTLLAFGLAAVANASPAFFFPGRPGSSAPGGGGGNNRVGQGHGGPPSRPGGGNWRGAGQSAGSPAYNLIFQKPLPIPQVAVPNYSEVRDGRTINYFYSEIKPFDHQVYPDLGPAHMIGYNGTAPGPTYIIEKDSETIIRYVNDGQLSSSVHLHGAYTHAAWDGWAADEIPVGSYKDYYYPNSETARTIWYHDHAESHTAPDAYYGQAGFYIIHDPAEDSLGLPSGQYDIPLALSDKSYQSNGDLQSPTTSTIGFFGDTIQVNEQPWPFLTVEPRKYRFRFVDMSLSRAYDLFLADASQNQIPFQIIASDSGLFGSPVSASDFVIAMGERYEIVVDFSGYANQNITLGNKMQQFEILEYDNTDKVMQFVVGGTVSDNTNNGAVPGVLNSNIQWPASRTTVDHTFNFEYNPTGPANEMWNINGVTFSDAANRILAKPPQGAVELWELSHRGGPGIHPVHVHLVNMQVISRTGGGRGLLPYETAGLKDVVLLLPGETVRVLASYGPWNGVYMFHCHNLIHEDNAMLVAMNVTMLEEFGYDFNSTQQFADPNDARFSAQPYNADLAAQNAVVSAVDALADLKAYLPAASLIQAEQQYYEKNVFLSEDGGNTQSKALASPGSLFGGNGAAPAPAAAAAPVLAAPVIAAPPVVVAPVIAAPAAAGPPSSGHPSSGPPSAGAPKSSPPSSGPPSSGPPSSGAPSSGASHSAPASNGSPSSNGHPSGPGGHGGHH